MSDHVERDELGEQLIASGFVANDYLLSINNGLSVPHTMELPAPWNLPSRLFRHPIEVSRPTSGRKRRIGLMHPLLEDHPFVQHVSATLGIELDLLGAPNEFGFSNRRNARWWHAVDLVSAGHWRDLIETMEFTTDEDVAGAVGFGLSYSAHDDLKAAGHITTNDARQMMAAIEISEPKDRAAILSSVSAPMICRNDGKENWPINAAFDTDPATRAWAKIIGIEEGWFKYDRAGFLGWTSLGRERFAARGKATYVEASGQSAFAF